MNFRIGQPSDAAALAAISIEVWLGTYMQKGVSAFFAEYALDEFTPAKMTALLKEPHEHVIVSEIDGGIDGFIRLRYGKAAPVSGCSTLEIATLYVRARRQREGLGRALLEQGLAYACHANAPSVWLTTNSENAPAIAFYLKQGFEKIVSTRLWPPSEALVLRLASCRY